MMATARVCNFSNLFVAIGRYRAENHLLRAIGSQLNTNPWTSCRTHATTTTPSSLSPQATTADLVLPNLMDIPTDRIVKRRSYLKSFYCNAFAYLYNQYNENFRMKDFWDEVPATVEKISQHLSRQEYAKLHYDVAPDVLRALKQNIDRMTVQQREQIALRRVDIVRMYSTYIRYVYPGGDRPDGARYFEITAVFHARKQLPKDAKKLSQLMVR